jgi:hypothetical protein
LLTRGHSVDGEADQRQTLEAAGITPSSSKTYTLKAIQAAFVNSFGYDVYVDCSSSTLSQVYYTFNVKGSVQTGTFVPTSPSEFPHPIQQITSFLSIRTAFSVL